MRKCVPTTPPTYDMSDEMGESIKVLRTGTAERFSAQKQSDREDYPFVTQKRRKNQTLHSVVGLSEKNSTTGLTRSTTSIKTVTAAAAATAVRERKSELRISEVLTVCQIVAWFLIVIVSLLNLSLSDRDKALWSTLVGAGFGYLVPNPNSNASAAAVATMSEFTISLPSNRSIDLYLSKVSQWKTKLSEFVELQDKWEVGLLEVSFLGKVHNIYGNRYYLIVGGLSTEWTIVLDDGTYYTIHSIIGPHRDGSSERFSDCSGTYCIRL